MYSKKCSNTQLHSILPTVRVRTNVFAVLSQRFFLEINLNKKNLSVTGCSLSKLNLLYSRNDYRTNNTRPRFNRR